MLFSTKCCQTIFKFVKANNVSLDENMKEKKAFFLKAVLKINLFSSWKYFHLFVCLKFYGLKQLQVFVANIDKL